MKSVVGYAVGKVGLGLGLAASFSKLSSVLTQSLLWTSNYPLEDKLLERAASALSDQQKRDVLLNALQAYRWIVSYNTSDVFRQNVTHQGHTPENRFYLHGSPQEMEQVIERTVRRLVKHSIFPTTVADQLLMLEHLELDEEKMRGSVDNGCLPALINEIPWRGEALNALAEFSLYGFHVYNPTKMFTRINALDFLSRHFNHIDWTSGKEPENPLWSRALGVLPVELAEKIIQKTPKLATHTDSLGRVVGCMLHYNWIEPSFVKTLLAHGATTDKIRKCMGLRVSLMEPRDNLRACLEDVDRQIQRQKIADSLDLPTARSSPRRKM